MGSYGTLLALSNALHVNIAVLTIGCHGPCGITWVGDDHRNGLHTVILALHQSHYYEIINPHILPRELFRSPSQFRSEEDLYSAFHGGGSGGPTKVTLEDLGDNPVSSDDEDVEDDGEQGYNVVEDDDRDGDDDHEKVDGQQDTIEEEDVAQDLPGNKIDAEVDEALEQLQDTLQEWNDGQVEFARQYRKGQYGSHEPRKVDPTRFPGKVKIAIDTSGRFAKKAMAAITIDVPITRSDADPNKSTTETMVSLDSIFGNSRSCPMERDLLNKGGAVGPWNSVFASIHGKSILMTPQQRAEALIAGLDIRRDELLSFGPKDPVDRRFGIYTVPDNPPGGGVSAVPSVDAKGADGTEMTGLATHVKGAIQKVASARAQAKKSHEEHKNKWGLTGKVANGSIAGVFCSASFIPLPMAILFLTKMSSLGSKKDNVSYLSSTVTQEQRNFAKGMISLLTVHEDITEIVQRGGHMGFVSDSDLDKRTITNLKAMITRLKNLKSEHFDKITAGEKAFQVARSIQGMSQAMLNDFVSKAPDRIRAKDRLYDSSTSTGLVRLSKDAEEFVGMRATDPGGTVVVCDRNKLLYLMIIRHILEGGATFDEWMKEPYIEVLLSIDGKYLQNGYHYTTGTVTMTRGPSVNAYSVKHNVPVAIAADEDSKYTIQRIVNDLKLDDHDVCGLEADGNQVPLPDNAGDMTVPDREVFGACNKKRSIVGIRASRTRSHIDFGSGLTKFVHEIIVLDLKARWGAGQGDSTTCFCCGDTQDEWAEPNPTPMPFRILGRRFNKFNPPHSAGTDECRLCRKRLIQDAEQVALLHNLLIETDDVSDEQLKKAFADVEEACAKAQAPIVCTCCVDDTHDNSGVPLELSVDGVAVCCNVDCARHNMKNNLENSIVLLCQNGKRIQELCSSLPEFAGFLGEIKKHIKEIPGLESVVFGESKMDAKRINGHVVSSEECKEFIQTISSLHGDRAREFFARNKAIVVVDDRTGNILPEITTLAQKTAKERQITKALYPNGVPRLWLPRELDMIAAYDEKTKKEWGSKPHGEEYGNGVEDEYVPPDDGSEELEMYGGVEFSKGYKPTAKPTATTGRDTAPAMGPRMTTFLRRRGCTKRSEYYTTKNKHVLGRHPLRTVRWKAAFEPLLEMLEEKRQHMITYIENSKEKVDLGHRLENARQKKKGHGSIKVLPNDIPEKLESLIKHFRALDYIFNAMLGVEDSLVADEYRARWFPKSLPDSPLADQMTIDILSLDREPITTRILTEEEDILLRKALPRHYEVLPRNSDGRVVVPWYYTVPEPTGKDTIEKRKAQRLQRRLDRKLLSPERKRELIGVMRIVCKANRLDQKVDEYIATKVDILGLNYSEQTRGMYFKSFIKSYLHQLRHSWERLVLHGSQKRYTADVEESSHKRLAQMHRGVCSAHTARYDAHERYKGGNAWQMLSRAVTREYSEVLFLMHKHGFLGDTLEEFMNSNSGTIGTAPLPVVPSTLDGVFFNMTTSDAAVSDQPDETAPATPVSDAMADETAPATPVSDAMADETVPTAPIAVIQHLPAASAVFSNLKKAKAKIADSVRKGQQTRRRNLFAKESAAEALRMTTGQKKHHEPRRSIYIDSLPREFAYRNEVFQLAAVEKKARCLEKDDHDDDEDSETPATNGGLVPTRKILPTGSSILPTLAKAKLSLEPERPRPGDNDCSTTSLHSLLGIPSDPSPLVIGEYIQRLAYVQMKQIIETMDLPGYTSGQPSKKRINLWPTEEKTRSALHTLLQGKMPAPVRVHTDKEAALLKRQSSQHQGGPRGWQGDCADVNDKGLSKMNTGKPTERCLAFFTKLERRKVYLLSCLTDEVFRDSERFPTEKLVAILELLPTCEGSKGISRFRSIALLSTIIKTCRNQLDMPCHDINLSPHGRASSPRWLDLVVKELTSDCGTGPSSCWKSFGGHIYRDLQTEEKIMDAQCAPVAMDTSSLVDSEAVVAVTMPKATGKAPRKSKAPAAKKKKAKAGSSSADPQPTPPTASSSAPKKRSKPDSDSRTGSRGWGRRTRPRPNEAAGRALIPAEDVPGARSSPATARSLTPTDWAGRLTRLTRPHRIRAQVATPRARRRPAGRPAGPGPAGPRVPVVRCRPVESAG